MRDRARRLRGLYWSALLLSLVALIGCGVVAYLAYQDTSGPSGAVTGYYSALQDSDAARALAYGDLPSGPRTLLTATVLRDQQRLAPLRDVKIVSVQRSGPDATVMVGYQLDFPAGAQSVTDTVLVHHRGSSWRLDQVAVSTSIRMTQARERATIVGTGVPDSPTLLFPGALPVRFDSPYVQVVPDTGITFNASSPIVPGLEVSAAGRKAVVSVLTTSLQSCFAAGGDSDLRCPLPSNRFVPGSLTGQIRGPITDGLTLAVGSSPAGVIDVSGTVSVVGTYRKLDFDNIAATGHGTVQVPFEASTYVKPIELRWMADQ